MVALKGTMYRRGNRFAHHTGALLTNESCTFWDLSLSFFTLFLCPSFGFCCSLCDTRRAKRAMAAQPGQTTHLQTLAFAILDDGLRY